MFFTQKYPDLRYSFVTQGGYCEECETLTHVFFCSQLQCFFYLGHAKSIHSSSSPPTCYFLAVLVKFHYFLYHVIECRPGHERPLPHPYGLATRLLLKCERIMASYVSVVVVAKNKHAKIF